jgi:transposase
MDPKQRTPRKHYEETFKRSAVELLLSGSRPLAQIAAELGIGEWLLRDWKSRYAVAAPSRTEAELAAENQALRQELQRVRNQRDILKKTLGILSTPSDNDLSA